MGMTLEIMSVDEGLSNQDGDVDAPTGRTYAGLTDGVVSLDTESAGWWRGGHFVVDLQNVRGDDISEFVGDVQGTSNIVAPPGTRFRPRNQSSGSPRATITSVSSSAKVSSIAA